MKSLGVNCPHAHAFKNPTPTRNAFAGNKEKLKNFVDFQKHELQKKN